MNLPEEQENIIFPPGEKAPVDYFTGTAWVQLLGPNVCLYNCQIGNVVFEAGARNNWHTQSGGQILLVTGGTGYYQEKGKPVEIIRKGDVVKIAPDVVHWHGASHENSLTHIAINPNTQNGIVSWMEPVSETEYNTISGH
jgi:quercetin dioxygenase-like cupin family protein